MSIADKIRGLLINRGIYVEYVVVNGEIILFHKGEEIKVPSNVTVKDVVRRITNREYGATVAGV